MSYIRQPPNRPRQIPTFPVEIAPNGPYRNAAGLWLLNQPGIARDISGNQNPGTIVGSLPITGTPMGPMTQFTSASTYVTWANNPLNGATAFTVGGLVIPPVGGANNVSLFCSWSTPNQMLTRGGGGAISFYTKNASGTQAGGQIGTYTQGVLQHWAFVYNGSLMYWLLNGVRQPTTFTQTGAMPVAPYLHLSGIGGSEYPMAGIIGSAFVATHAIPDSQIAAMAAAPFATSGPNAALRPLTRRKYYVASGASPLVVTPGAGSITLTGQPPSVDATVAPGAGSVAFTGHAPTADATATPGTGSVAFAGHAPSADATATPGAGSIVITGYAPAISGTGLVVSPGTGSITITGFAPQLEGLAPRTGGAADEARRKWLEWARTRKRRAPAPKSEAPSVPVAEPIEAQPTEPPPALPQLPVDALLAANLQRVREQRLADAAAAAERAAIAAAIEEEDELVLLMVA